MLYYTKELLITGIIIGETHLFCQSHLLFLAPIWASHLHPLEHLELALWSMQFFYIILSHVREWVWLIDGVWIGEWIYWPHVHITQNYTLPITDTHRLVSSVHYSIHKPFPGNGFYRGRFFSFPYSRHLVTAAHAELLSTENLTNWVPSWRPFHTILLVFSSQADFQLNSLTHQLATSCH
jgi:hypothetical protein